MGPIRRWLIVPLLTTLLGLLAACVVELRPDNSMLIYVPPPALRTPGMTVPAAAPGTIPALALATVNARTPLTATVPTTATAPVTGTPSMTATATGTATVTGTATITGTATTTATATVTTTGTAVLTPAPTAGPGTPRPPATGTAATTPTVIATGATPRSTLTQAVTPTPRTTATRQSTTTRTPTRDVTATRTKTPTRRATPTGGTAAPTPTAIPGTVFLGRHQGFADNGRYYVVGEVLNGDSYPVFNVKVIGSFYDGNNTLVAAQEATTLFAQIEPELSSPFKLAVSSGSDAIERYELTLVWDDVSVVDYEELTIETAEHDEDAGEIRGELHNDGSVSVDRIVVAATLYSDAGEVVDVIVGSVSQPVLAAGESSAYTIALPPDIEFERFEVQAQGALKLF